MPKYLIHQGEEPRGYMIVNEPNEEKAILSYCENIKPDEFFIEHVQENSFSEKFFCDDESEGQEDLPQEVIDSRIFQYFKEKPEYEKIYRESWHNQTAYFPDEMIKWIHKKELLSDDWTTLTIINLDEVPILNN
jgi:hypothetical protein